MRSSSPVIERARPWLGTYVTVRVHGLMAPEASLAIDAAFAQVARVHRLMSFQEPASDVSRLNRSAHGEPVAVDPSTYEVLARAAELSAASDGVFDVTAVSRLATDLDPRASWRDVELLPDNRVSFARRLSLDLSGIAKGYAVDRALEAALTFAPAQVCVNAGGDLRVAGAETEMVQLRTGMQGDALPVVAIKDASIASSGGPLAAVTHLDPTAEHPVPGHRFVSVVAPHCIDADACTKVLLARASDASKFLRAMKARGFFFEPAAGWREVA